MAEETGGSGDYSMLSHPWVAASTDGQDNTIRLWMRRNAGTSAQPDSHTVRVDSLDVWGADFGLECTGTCSVAGDTCATGEFCDYDDDSADGGLGVIDICADGDSACAYMNGMRHGRIRWDYIFFGAIDWGVDSPVMVCDRAA